MPAELNGGSAHDPLEQFDGAGESALLAVGEAMEALDEDSHATLASSLEKLRSFRGRGDPNHPAVARIGLAGGETGLDQALDDPRHGRRLDLLGRRELGERERSCEDDDRQSGEARTADSARLVLATDQP